MSSHDLAAATRRYKEHNDRVAASQARGSVPPPAPRADAYEGQLAVFEHSDKLLTTLERYLRGGRRAANIYLVSGRFHIQLGDANAHEFHESEKPTLRDALAHALQEAALGDR